MNPHIELIRPNVCLLSVLGLIVGAIVAGALVTELVYALIAVFLICGAGNVINDVFDVEIDKINKPNRPIPSGRIDRGQAKVFFGLLVVIGAVLAYLVSVLFLLIALINIVVLYVYSWKLKPVAFVGNVAVAYLGASSFLAAGLILGDFSISTAVFALAVVSFLGTLSREILKDMEDAYGDFKEGARTLPIRIGMRWSKLVAYIILTGACLSLILPLEVLSVYYLIGAVPGVIICAASLMYTPAKAQKLIKIAMYLVMAGFLLGSELFFL
jgi:geranylgeranylglycerol-phosphate geranylgeranyltransferase